MVFEDVIRRWKPEPHIYMLDRNDVLENTISKEVTENQNNYIWLISKVKGKFYTMVK